MSREIEIESLRNIVNQFHSALLRCSLSDLPIVFETFPKGCCSHAVLLLGAFLEDQGFGTFQRIAGERGNKNRPPFDWESHAWAQKGEILVDITAGQFPDGSSDFVILGQGPFHRSFNGVRTSVASFREYDDATKHLCEKAYVAVMTEVKKLQHITD